MPPDKGGGKEINMKSRRDDFLQSTKDLLAKRVGYKCSNPNCAKPTCGASDNPTDYTNIGVAAHICAAAKGGPRYDPNMTPDERKSINNGIWLCQSCSKLIDSDTSRYSIKLLREWKSNAEESSVINLEKNTSIPSANEDIELIKFFVQCLDRPAFKDRIRNEGSMEDFEKAVIDTMIAFNTGTLRDRNNNFLRRAGGKSLINNTEWRLKLNEIVNILEDMSRRLKQAKKCKTFWQRSDGFYYFSDMKLELMLDNSRRDIIKIMTTICKEAGLPLPILEL